MLTGLVERVTYQNTENGFCVLRVKARGQRELVTLVGHAAAISAGEWVRHRQLGQRPHPRPAVQGPVPQDLCARVGRGYREVPRFGHDPRDWPGLCQEAPARLRRQGVRCHRCRLKELWEDPDDVGALMFDLICRISAEQGLIEEVVGPNGEHVFRRIERPAPEEHGR